MEFIDLMSLLPSVKEQVVNDRKEDKSDEARKRSVPRSFNNWLQAFCIYASVLGEKFPSKCRGLFQHLDIILEAYRNFGGMVWFNYDENFRQKLSIHPTLKWGIKDIGLWINLMLPQRTNVVKQAPSKALKKGVCFALNESTCKWLSNCRYKHECSFCGGTHPMSKCFKRSGNFSSTREQLSKSLDASEVGKNAPLVKGIPRQGDN